MARIAILAAGDYPTHPTPLAALREADHIVCCDSAYATLEAHGLPQGSVVVVGDGDSLPLALRQRLGERFVHITEQDFNDLHKAVGWAIDGATGRREDHTIGNIAYLATFADEHTGLDVAMLTNYGQFSLVRGSRTFASQPGQQVSLFALDPEQPVSASGLQWPLCRRRLGTLWQGTLNAALGPQFTVEGYNLLVYQTHDTKEAAK